MALADVKTRSLVGRIRTLAERQHEQRRRGLSLGCAESTTSDLVREMLATDFGRRYGTKGGYAGGGLLDEVEAIGEGIARDLFGCEFAILSPITGHVALEAVLAGLTDRGDTVMTMRPEDGGYPTAIVERLGLGVAYFAFDKAAFNLDVATTIARIVETRPRLVVFGSARYLFPHPVADLQAACREVGAVIAYDASHPFGLIAGGAFHDPFEEGVDVMFGSTSKTLFGPTRGLILVREDEKIYEQVTSVFSRFMLQSTYQLNSLAGLAVSLAESREFGTEFARSVISNAQRLARRLDDAGVPAVARDLGYTQSQLVLPTLIESPETERSAIRARLERVGIYVDRYVRIGTQQVTRLGMGPVEMDRIGDLVAAAIHANDDDADGLRRIASATEDLATQFPVLHYTFGQESPAFRYVRFDGNDDSHRGEQP
jgi:glycine hydroxymethyltransferase